MKVSVDIDCTPEEARRFLGLPDLSAVHDIYLDQMKKALSEGTGPEYVADMMKNWGPMSESGLALWRQMLDQVGGKR
jgi:hypothetical protein